MIKQKYSVLFLGKKNDEYVEKALRFCRSNFTDVMDSLGGWGDPLPDEIERWEGDYIFSYLSRWIIPEHLLKRAKVAAINFHPAPPEYPGVGCNNFALYEGAKEYGVTCHHMASRVDSGNIIKVSRFPIMTTDTVSTLLARTYDYQLVLFYEIVSLILQDNPLTLSGERWSGRLHSRKELDDLGQISADMTKEEIANRIRATTFGEWKPTIDLQGFIFELKANQRGD